MAEQARSALDAGTIEVVADRGYYAGEETPDHTGPMIYARRDHSVLNRVTFERNF